MANLPKDVYQPETANRSGRAVLMLTTDGTEDLEFFYPYYRFIEAGYKVDVVTPEGQGFKGKQGLGLKETRKITDVKAEDYELLYIPGGKAPEALKKDEAAVALTRKFVTLGKPVAAICHGPQMLAAAGVIEGRKIAGWPDIENEILEAGAQYVDKESVTDSLFVTARWPADLPAHMKETLALLNRNNFTGAAAA